MDILVSVLIERLASITLAKASIELELVVGVEGEVANLIRNLEAIQDVLEDAEQRQVKEAHVRRWLNNLKQLSNEMDDVLDEWSTALLKQQIEEGENQGEIADLVITKKKKKKKVRFPHFSFGKVNRVIQRHDIALKIKNLNERLNEIAEDRQRYNFQNTEKRGGEQLGRQKTSSLVDISFGRETEMMSLVSKLVSKGSQERNGPLIIPIVGMGGIGKTTLSQLAFNHEWVKAHFDLRIWVCVSYPFDEIRIGKAIVEGLGKKMELISDQSEELISDQLEGIVQCIKKNIEGNKFLLVLDDVWNPKPRQWEELRKPLCNGGIGSTILVTTRTEKVANIMGAETHKIHLEELSEYYCKELFNYNAFNGRENDRKMFEDVGNKIAKKCKGLPLAAKTLGSLMRSKKKLVEWQDVLNNKIWEQEEFEEEVFQPLLLSYYDLTPRIRRCLLYCAIFPKDYVIDKDVLIKLWMSQDYLNVEGKKEQMKIGQTYFDNLVMRSFFQNFKKDDDGNIISCKMHDIIHDFVQYLTKEECIIMEKDDGERIRNDKILHLTVMFASDGSFPSSLYISKNLRTLTNFDTEITTIGPDLILQMKCLRTLNLSWNCIEEIPEEIGKLIHLRYLDLSDNKGLKALPDAIGELYNLQTLRCIGCQGLKKMPYMGRLINLKHLQIKGTWRPNIKGIGRLRNLQTLDVLRLNCGAEGPKVEDLKNLDHLQGHLVISNLRTVEDASEAEKAQLVNKKQLLHLELQYGSGEILNALQPHPALDSLSMSISHGTTSFPNWLMLLQSLRELFIGSCGSCTVMPPFGKLLSLEYLEILYCEMWKVGVEFLGIESSPSSSSPQILFPKLKHLKFQWMYEWEEWEGVEGWREEENSHDQITIMPSLSILEFYHCEKLETLPNFLRKTPLQNLVMVSFNSMLKQDFKKGGKEWDKISHSANIRLTGGTIQKDGVQVLDDYETEEDDYETEKDDDPDRQTQDR